RVAAYGPDERERVRRQADAAAADRRSFTDRGLGRSALYGFHYLTWTVPLLEQYLLTGDECPLRAWEEIFHRWYDSRDDVRGDWPGLDVVWYTLGVGVRTPIFIDALDAAGAALARETRVRLLGSILGGARWLADEHDEFRPGNWQLVGACTLLCAGALFDEFAESAGWVATARARITEHLDRDVHPDGGHHERSPGYHRLCLEFLHRAALHAERYLDRPLGADERVAAMSDWLVAIATPEGWLPPFQDSAHVAAGPSLVVAHRWAPKPAYKALATATMPAAAVEEILARLPARDGVPAARAWAHAPAEDPADSADLGAWLSGSRYFVSRSGRRPGSLYAAVNCGPRVPHELESHSHRACLDFVLCGHGQPLAWEAGGPDSYDDPEYYEWFQSPAAHSTVVFDGREPELDAGATVDALVFRPELDVLAAHHDGWGPRHRRTFLAVRPAGELPGYWLVRDEVATTGGWRWLLHGRSPWRRTGASTFVSAEPPGLLVCVTGTWTSATRVGRASYPSADGPCWGELHCLELTPSAGVLTALLVPFADAPPEVTVTEPAPDRLHVTWPTTVDELTAGGWTRDAGSPVTWPSG
ncbi:heparinase II/III family protein, partial [Actinophytocola sp.]|uniref:heparinase II/III family protein n=1 Tax=Actinophytocola sp. TaxID=1872138 RepID=UPI003D6B2E43